VYAFSLNTPRYAHAMIAYKGGHTRILPTSQLFEQVDANYECAGRVFVLGGSDAANNAIPSVEMLSSSQGWQILPTPMFAADYWFAYVGLP
jgi:hypothetical protein